MKLHHPQLKTALRPLCELVWAFLNPNARGRVFVMYGLNGCGKTRIAKSIGGIFESKRFDIGPVNYEGGLEEERGPKIADKLFVHWPAAIQGIKQDKWQVFEDCVHEYLVILDDIGAEHDPSGIGLEKLYLILNRREHKHTLITTNFPPEEWESKFERRIASRLFRNAVHIDLSKVPDFNSV